MSILNLPRWRVLHVDEGGQDICIMAEREDLPTHCPRCGVVFNAVGFGTSEPVYLDQPIRAKRVYIHTKRRRFKCRECSKTFMEPFPEMDSTRQATNRLIEWVKQQSLKRTFLSIADDTGMDEKTVRDIFRAHIEELKESIRFETPEWLGIDELHIASQPRAIFTNVKERSVIELLEKRDLKTIRGYLSRIPDRDKIKLVAMDMWVPYRDAVRSLLPQATIVIDKFHVVRLANQCLDAVRKSIRASLTSAQRRTLMHDRFILLKRKADLGAKDLLILEVWIANIPQLGQAYALKETFYDIWTATEREEALKRYRAWRDGVPADLKEHFKPLLTALANWETEIFAYFDHPITNAYTEAVNGLAKVVNRNGRGYSFDAIRAKMLYAAGDMYMRRPSKPKSLRPNPRVPAQPQEGIRHLVQIIPGSYHSGIPISTIANAFDQDILRVLSTSSIDRDEARQKLRSTLKSE